MELREFKGKTVEEAITEATVNLGVTSADLYYEVCDKGSSGLFGIGSKDAVIKACLKSEYEAAKDDERKTSSNEASEDESFAVSDKADSKKEEVKTAENKERAEKKEIRRDDRKREEAPVNPEEAIKVAETFLYDVFEKMNLEVKINSKFDENENYLNIDLEGPEMGIIIGKRGQTLDSLQYLVNLAVNRKSEGYVRVKIDTEDYRRRRKETLENFAHNTAHKVKKTGRPVVLEAMNPYERRVIHAALSNNDYVQTHSEGQEPYRRVVVTLKR